MDNKGQGALEYLLIIVGAILIAAIVIIVLNYLGIMGKGFATNGFDHANDYLNADAYR